MPVHDWLPDALRKCAIERELKTGEALFRLDDATVGLWEIVAGRVRLSRVDASGREIVLYIAGPGETIAEASLFSARYHCDAIANSKATVRLYPKRHVFSTFERDAKAARAFSAMLAHQVMNLRTRIEQRNIRSARERVRHFLAVNAASDGRIELTGTLKDAAAEIGLTHEALYRALSALEQAGEIRRSGGRIKLLRRV
jgi:CRP-like cAMP-binding protein